MTRVSFSELKRIQKMNKMRKKAHAQENSSLSALGLASNGPNPPQGSTIPPGRYPFKPPPTGRVQTEQLNESVGTRYHVKLTTLRQVALSTKLSTGNKLAPVRKLKEILKNLIHTGVKIRDKRANNGLCLTCSAEPIYAAGHIIPDSDSLNTRYDPLNLYGVGRRCNFKEFTHRSEWARVGGVFWTVFGPERMIELSGRARVRVKWGPVEYSEKIAEARKWLETIMLGGS